MKSRLLIAVLLVAAAATVGSVFVDPAPSYAGTATCNANFDCYSQVEFGGRGSSERFHGLNTNVFAHCLSVTGKQNAFVSDEAWLTGYFDKTVWIEAGIAYGNPVGNSRFFYWADSRSPQGYYEHDDSSDSPPSLGGDSTSYQVQILPRDSNSYNVSSGPYSGISVSWPTNYGFNSLKTGSETYFDGSTSDYVGGSTAMRWDSQNNNIVTNWSYGSDHTFNDTSPSGWGFVSTVTPDYEYLDGVSTSC